MKRTRHQYHYAVRRCKNNRINIPKQKLAENISDSKPFWKEFKKISPANKIVTTVMDNAIGDIQITDVLKHKYNSLDNSVPTSDAEMQSLYSIVNNGTNRHQLQDIYVTSDIIAQCIKRLKRSKSDGNYGFKSDHLINGGKRLHILLSMLFREYVNPWL